MLLFRQSKRIPEPTTENQLTAFASAVKVADGYFKQSNADSGNIKYVFHPCHHCFASAVAFLHALSRCKSEISCKYSWYEIETWMSVFSRFFLTIAERWPAAMRCLEEYERLLDPVRTEYLEFLNKSPQMPAVRHVANPLYSYPGPPSDIGDALSFLTAFSPATMADPTDQKPAQAYSTPQDWNTEFNLKLGMETTSEG